MQNYINQLLTDISEATKNVSRPFVEKQLSLHDFISDEDEEKIAPICNLQQWTGIQQEMLPPATMPSDTQVTSLLDALKKMLDTYNCSFVLQTKVPERIQYAAIRDNFNQDVKVKQWNMGFFEFCKPGTIHHTCSLARYCQCAFFEELLAGFSDEVLSKEEERERILEIEVNYVRKKYGEYYMKYYPFHLDKNYDDANGNPYDYGFEEDEDADDNWWWK